MANTQHVENDQKQEKNLSEVRLLSATGPVSGEAVCSVPSFAAASELLSAPYSCLVRNTHRRHVALSPMYINKKKTGIKDELDAELLKFSQSLSGVPLAYDNIRIVGHKGDINDDSGFIHINIEANFIVFQPKKGQQLLGKVNKLAASHVGCLVHGCFNASIPKPNLVSMETWRDAGPQIGSELEFEVTALDADTVGVLLIRGRLTRTRVQELLAIGESSESTLQQSDEPEAESSQITPKPGANEMPEAESSQMSPEEPPKKKKKKKDKNKIKDEPLTDPFVQDQDTMQELDGTMDERNGNAEKKTTKKKKKDKQLKEEPQEVELSSVEVHGSDSSGYLSDKPSKKRKHQTEITPGFSEEFETPSKKKKKTH